MMHLFINSLAASAGGGLTYTRNMIPHLAGRSDVRVTAAVSPNLAEEFHHFSNVECISLEMPVGRRFWREQSLLPGLIRRSAADVLLSTGNFALRRSPVPQILLSRNSIYTSADYSRDLLSRGELRSWLDTRLRAVLAKKSITWADVTVAPSQAFAAELEQWTGKQIFTIHHGFDHEAFIRGSDGLPANIEAQIAAAETSFKLLFVSHYNYYRNFETLIRALPVLRSRLESPVKLLLTCHLETGKNPGSYRADAAAKLVRELGVSDMIVELGSIPYGNLHHLYARADLYVTPAYTETFAHPLVEAMACGVPIAASNIAVHREICGTAAEYFPTFSPDQLADRLVQLVKSPEKRRGMAAKGLERSKEFSWATHVDRILDLARSLTSRANPLPTLSHAS